MLFLLTILTPFLLLGIVALLGFVGCATLLGIDDVSYAPANSASLTATPSSVTVGGKVTLKYEAPNALQVFIKDSKQKTILQPTFKTDPAFGQDVVDTPQESTTYTLTATFQQGQPVLATTPVTVLVPPPAPPSASLAADALTLHHGQSTKLRWNTSNATSASISPGIGSVPTSSVSAGSTPVQPGQTTTYTLTATGPGGSADSNPVTITVH